MEEGHRRCFRVMDTADPALLETWMAAWRDLVEFEVIPVMTSQEAAQHFSGPN
ncbi:MAG: DUF3303 family protein [Zavarzinella sp.]|nr:DUF3303 family protein [Zavarzinella sp.]